MVYITKTRQLVRDCKPTPRDQDRNPGPPLRSHDAIKHHFTSRKTDLIFLQLGVFQGKFPWNYFSNIWQFSLIFRPLQVIFIHYKSKIATAMRGL